MAVTRTIVQSSQGANGATLTSSYTLTSDSEVNFSQAVPNVTSSTVNTTVTAGANSATQTVASTAGMTVDMVLAFYNGSATTYCVVQSIASATSVVLTASINTTLGSWTVTGAGTYYGLEVPYAGIQSVFFLAGATCTLYFNGIGSPLATFALSAGVTYNWSIDDYAISATACPKPFSGNITSVTVVNSGSTTAQVDLSFLVAV